MISLIYGPNHFARRVALQSLTVQSANNSLEQFDGDALTVGQLDTIFRGVSLFSTQKTVIIHDASQNKLVWEALEPWCDTLPEGTSLILNETAVDKRTHTFKRLQKVAQMIECRELDEASLAAWVREQVSLRGSEMSAGDARYLIGRVGLEQASLAHELDKLTLMTTTIHRADIDRYVEPTDEGNVFALLDAVFLRRNAREVHAQLALLKSSDDAYRTFGLIVNQVFTLALVHSAKNITQGDLAKQAKIHPFVIKKMQQTAKNLSSAQIKTIVRTVAKLDDSLKSSALAPWDLLEVALTKIVAV